MEKTKLISVRVPIDVLEAINKVSSPNTYYKKSDYINAALVLIVEVEKRGLFPNVLRYRPRFGDVIDEITFKYHREKL